MQRGSAPLPGARGCPPYLALRPPSWPGRGLGAFELPNFLVSKINADTPLALESVPDALAEKGVLNGGGLYLGADPATPLIGDTRLTWRVVEPTTVSVVARQIGNTFEPHRTEAGGTIAMLKMGTFSAENMFAAAKDANATMTWILRVVGFVMMVIGISMVVSPIVVFADVIPFLGDLIGMGTMLFAGLVSFSLSLVTISIAWVAFRPLVGVPLLVVAVGSIVGAKMLHKKKSTGAPEVTGKGSETPAKDADITIK